MKLFELLERMSIAIGRAVAWLAFVMAAVTCAIVIMRYAFDSGWIWLQESVTWMHAAVFLLAAAYTLARDEHVRVDIFYRKFSSRKKAIVDLCGVLLLLLPVALYLLISSWSYVGDSWALRESSPEAGGLVYPLPSLMKSLIPVTSILLVLQGLALIARSLRVLRGAG